MGVEALAEFLVAEIQEVYRLQGVKINDKHIEVIVRQMLQKVEITDGGDTTLLPAEQLDYLEMMEYNAKLPKNGKPAVGRPVLLRSEEHTSELQSLMRISYAVFCLKKKTKIKTHSIKYENRKTANKTNDNRHKHQT